MAQVGLGWAQVAQVGLAYLHPASDPPGDFFCDANTKSKQKYKLYQNTGLDSNCFIFLS